MQAGRPRVELSPEQAEGFRAKVVDEQLSVRDASKALGLSYKACRRLARENGWRAPLGAKPTVTGYDEDGVLRRTCKTCATRKPIEKFAANRNLPYGRGYVCRDCRLVSKGPAA